MTVTFDPRTVAQLLKMDLDDMFNAWEAAKPLRTGAPHASAILAPESEWCVRRQVLSAVYPDQATRPEAKPWSGHQNAVFLNGWVLHEKYQKLLSEHAQVTEVETSHYDETRFLHFTPDAVIEWAALPWVVEIKGYKASSFEAMDEAGDPPAAAWHQCNLYCHLLGIEQGIVLVECKDTQEYKLWAIQHDPELAKPYTERMYQVKGRTALAKAGKGIPERKCVSINDRLAQKCVMRELCFTWRG